jgi:hypothetical protein
VEDKGDVMKKFVLLLLFFLLAVTMSYSVQISNQTTYPIKVVISYTCQGNDAAALANDSDQSYAEYNFFLPKKGDISDVFPMVVNKSKVVCNLALDTIQATAIVSDSVEITKKWTSDMIKKNQNILSISTYRGVTAPDLSLQ